MSRSLQENTDKYAAKQVIRSLDFVVYMNPLGIPPISIPRHLIEGFVSQGVDFMDASQLIAEAARPAMARLRAMRFGQVEILNLPEPFSEDLHVLIWTRGGQDNYFVSDQPFFPY
jgi:hypothetical protein